MSDRGAAIAVPDETPSSPPPGRVDEDLQRRVAVLIMVVSLLGAVFAFLQTAASNRSVRATRRSDTAAVEAMAELARVGGLISVEGEIWKMAEEDMALAASLAAASSGQTGPYAAALARGLLAAREAILPYTDLGDAVYLRSDGTPNWALFEVDARAPSFRAAEYQKAYAAERDAWGAKGGAYVAVVTVLAVALFLIGLSRTVAWSGHLLVGAGFGLAVIATVWGFSVFARPVIPASPVAIDAYVEGLVASNSVLFEGDPGRSEEPLTRAEEAFTRALAARTDYAEALMGRGTTRFRLDLLRSDGPAGSEGARDDFARAVGLDPLDPVAWGDLGAARFWLGDLEGAGEATRRALALDPDDLTFNLNLGLFLVLRDDADAYQAQLARIEAIAAGDDMPTWLRQAVVFRFAEVFDLAERYRADYADEVRRYREDVLRIDHQISVAKRFFGTTTPVAVAAEVSPLAFALSADGTQLEASFDATGVVPGARWLWRSYQGGIEDPTLSSEPEAWPFALPDDGVIITLTLPGGFLPGVPVRVEVFIEGNLLQVGEFVP